MSLIISVVLIMMEVLVLLWKYLESVGVIGELVVLSSLIDLIVLILILLGWVLMKNLNIILNMEMIVKGESYLMVMFMVFKLYWDFDIVEVFKYGIVDVWLLMNFIELDFLMVDFNGFLFLMI